MEVERKKIKGSGSIINLFVTKEFPIQKCGDYSL